MNLRDSKLHPHENVKRRHSEQIRFISSIRIYSFAKRRFVESGVPRHNVIMRSPHIRPVTLLCSLLHNYIFSNILNGDKLFRSVGFRS